jgi:hypothetical protein
MTVLPRYGVQCSNRKSRQHSAKRAKARRLYLRIVMLLKFPRLLCRTAPTGSRCRLSALPGPAHARFDNGMRKGAWSRRSFQSASVAANNDPLTKVAQSPRNTIADSAGDRSAALIINAIPVT